MRLTRRRRSASNGGALVETVLFLPILLLLMVGMFWMGTIAFTYYTLRNRLWTAASYAAVQQGIDFCDPNDPQVQGAINLALTGVDIDPGTDPILPNLTADMISINAEQLDPTSGVPTGCVCAIVGCDTEIGGSEPAFVTASIPNGYPITPLIPGVAIASGPILLKPVVRVPSGGT
jgi:hypothetical protein